MANRDVAMQQNRLVLIINFVVLCFYYSYNNTFLSFFDFYHMFIITL